MAAPDRPRAAASVTFLCHGHPRISGSHTKTVEFTRDADVTGGYYQPLRAELLVPLDLRRVGMSTGDSLISFLLQRIQCGLYGAGLDKIHQYNRDYTLNNNPVLSSLTVQVPGAGPVDAG